MAFSSLGNSDHVGFSVSINFPSNLQRDAPFHRLAYGYSHADWDGLCDHLRVVPWEDIFKLGASAAASEKASSPWFSASCAAAIVHRNHFFCLYQKDISSEYKVQTG